MFDLLNVDHFLIKIRGDSLCSFFIVVKFCLSFSSIDVLRICKFSACILRNHINLQFYIGTIEKAIVGYITYIVSILKTTSSMNVVRKNFDIDTLKIRK